jgi:hypothetical protein
MAPASGPKIGTFWKGLLLEGDTGVGVGVDSCLTAVGLGVAKKSGAPAGVAKPSGACISCFSILYYFH